MKLTVAIDGSLEADIALAVMEKLPLTQSAELSVVMVNAVPALVGASVAPRYFETFDVSEIQAIRIGRQVAEKTVKRVVDKLQVDGRTSKGVVLEGDPANCLLGFIQETKSDLIVSGCGTNSNLEAFFAGSVSRKLIHYSGASVLIGRPFTSCPPEGSHARLKAKQKLDLLVAVDGTAGSDLAIDSLAGLELQPFRKIYVLAIEPFTVLPDALFLALNGESNKTWSEVVALAAAGRLTGAAEHVEVLTGFGHASTEIRSAASERDVDLIVMGASRHGVLERLLLGSCAYETATKAPCPVLILRDEVPFSDQTTDQKVDN